MSSRTTAVGRNAGRPTSVRPGSGASGPSSGRFNDRRMTMIPQNQKGIKWSREDDMRLVQDLETIAKELEAGNGVHSDIKLSLQELDKPQDSRRIFSANGVVPTLISISSCWSVEELHHRVLEEASNVFSDVRLHPKFGATAGLAACTKVFLDLFGIEGVDVNVSDIQNPTAYKIRLLLNQLNGIIGVTSQYEATLKEHLVDLKGIEDRKSDLWGTQSHFDALERDHAVRVEQEKPEIDRLKAILAQKEEEERVCAAKVADTRDLAEKVMEKKRLLEQKAINGRNDNAVLKNKLENMQHQIVVDPENALKKLKEIEEEKAHKDAERNKAYEKYKGLAQWESQNLLKDMDDTLEMFAAAQKKDHKELLALEKEYRSIEGDLARSRDDLAIKEKDFKRAMDNLKDLEEKKINMRDDVAQKKKRQQQRIKELEKETKDMEKEVEKIRLNTEKLQLATTKKEEEVAALKVQREKWKEEYLAILAAHNAACEAATSEVMKKKAQCDARVRAQKEWHRRTFGYDLENRPQPDTNGKVSVSKVLPSHLVPIYKTASELKIHKDVRGGRWIVPDSVKATIAAMEHPIKEEPVQEQDRDVPNEGTNEQEPHTDSSTEQSR